MITRSISPLDRDKPKISYHQDNVNAAAPNSISLLPNRIYRASKFHERSIRSLLSVHDLTLCTPVFKLVSIEVVESEANLSLEFQTVRVWLDGWRFLVYIYDTCTFDHRNLGNKRNIEGIFWMEVIFDKLVR